MTLVGPSASTASHGVQADETALNIQSFNFEAVPEFRDKMMNKSGECILVAVGAVMANITLSGQCRGTTTGVMGFTFVATCTLANLTAMNSTYTALWGFSEGTGIILMTNATLGQTFDGYVMVNQSFEIYNGITAAT